MPPTSSEQLLADVRWVDALARSLVSDPATAEDLAQEAWYRALRCGESHPPRRWFSTVVRRLSIQGHRGAQHHGDRERAAARDEAGGAAFSLTGGLRLTFCD